MSDFSGLLFEGIFEKKTKKKRSSDKKFTLSKLIPECFEILDKPSRLRSLECLFVFDDEGKNVTFSIIEDKKYDDNVFDSIAQFKKLLKKKKCNCMGSRMQRVFVLYK